jgi:hypothetical protein
MDLERRVFISFQNPENLDARRRAVQDAVIRKVEELDLQPEMFFNAGTAASLAWSLQNAIDIIRRCVGAVILAFPRWTVSGPNGEEYRLVSEYAQIEGGIATALRVPILMLAERGVVDRGITWTGAGHPILYMPQDASPEWLGGDAFRHRFGVGRIRLRRAQTFS